MTNELHIAAIILIGYVTNIIERPPENGPRGNQWFRTNVISQVIQCSPPGMATVTNTVPVGTNVVISVPPPTAARFASTVKRPKVIK